MRLSQVLLLGLAVALVCGLPSDRALAADSVGNTMATAKFLNPFRYPSGVIETAGDVDWYYFLQSANQTAGCTYKGTLVTNKDGLWVRVFRGKTKGVKPTSMNQLTLIKQGILQQPLQALVYPLVKGYYYYMEFSAGLPGQTGTYIPRAP